MSFEFRQLKQIKEPTEIARIAHKEWVEVIRDGRFRWTAAVVLGLLGCCWMTPIAKG